MFLQWYDVCTKMVEPSFELPILSSHIPVHTMWLEKQIQKYNQGRKVSLPLEDEVSCHKCPVGVVPPFQGRLTRCICPGNKHCSESNNWVTGSFKETTKSKQTRSILEEEDKSTMMGVLAFWPLMSN